MTTPERWPNQEEALQFTLEHSCTMLDMEMGTGKTRVALDSVFEREDVRWILIVCPKSVLGVWHENLMKFHAEDAWDMETLSPKKTVKKKAEDLYKWKVEVQDDYKIRKFVVVNYDSVWRAPLGDLIYKQMNWDLVILDESHRAKSAGSKVSKYLAMLGKRVKYKMCLSGTPMANSPLDVYGQYRFLDPTIFGTNHYLFLQEYAIMGGPDLKFIVGYKNQQQLHDKFQSIAYTCKMSDIKDRLKLPEVLPMTRREVELPAKDIKAMKQLSKEFVAECGSGFVAVNNVLVKLLRLQQITSGFCEVQEGVFEDADIQELNTAKRDELTEILSDISPLSSVVVFCVFRHDIAAIHEAARESKRKSYELSGSANTLEDWKKEDGAVIAVQIQAGAEGVDMTKAHHAVYYSAPHSLAMYAQSKARLYRPGQGSPISFMHLIAKDTIDEAMFKSLERKEDVIESIKAGTFDFGYIH